MKQRELKRLRMAQSIQRELEEVEVKQADLEREGVVVEKALRSGDCMCSTLVHGCGSVSVLIYKLSFSVHTSEEGQLMLQWFQLVNKKNALVRYESELVIQ